MAYSIWAVLWVFPWLTSSVLVPNFRSRLDGNGKPVDIHDGNIVQWPNGGPYYWYGMGYGGCQIDTTGVDCAGLFESVASQPCGFQLNHSINIYTSQDLLTWTFVREALNISSRPQGIYFRPKVIYNPTTAKYVLWVNSLPVSSMTVSALDLYPNAVYVVAQSDTPGGPFEVVTQQASMLHQGSGDFDIFTNASGAWIAYTSFSTNHQMSVERLNANYTDSAQVGSGLFGPNPSEAPVFFQFMGTFYLMMGSTCCFCYSGAGVNVWTAVDPFGPWTDSGHDYAAAMGPGPQPPAPPSGPSTMTSRYRAQQSHVFTYGASTAHPVMVWAGDQWGMTSDGTKGHVFQYWQPLIWNTTSTPPLPMPMPMITGFDTADAFNLNSFFTGFCDKAEIGQLGQVLPQLGACQALPAPQIGNCTSNQLSTLSADCQLCISANHDPTTIMDICTPPDFMPQGNAPNPCTVMEAGSIMQFFGQCPVPTQPQCTGPALALLGTLSPQCSQCLTTALGQPGAIMICLPVNFGMEGNGAANATGPPAPPPVGLVPVRPPQGADITVVTAYISAKYHQTAFTVSAIVVMAPSALLLLAAAIIETEIVISAEAVFMYIVAAGPQAISLVQSGSQSVAATITSWGGSTKRAVCQSYSSNADGFKSMGLTHNAARTYYFLFAVDRLTDAGSLVNSVALSFQVTVTAIGKGKKLLIRTYNASFPAGVDVTTEGGMVVYAGNFTWNVTVPHTSAVSGELDNSTDTSSESSTSTNNDGLFGLLALLIFVPLTAAAIFYCYWSNRRLPPSIPYLEPAQAPIGMPISPTFFPGAYPMPGTYPAPYPAYSDFEGKFAPPMGPSFGSGTPFVSPAWAMPQ